MADYRHIKIEYKEGRVDIILNRPPVNILNIEMMNELRDVFRSLNDDTTLRVVTIRAEGKAFSAGVDVAEHTTDKVREMIDAFGKIFKRLWEINALTVAVVDGVALGGGCELAVGCDLIVASERSRFGQPEIKAGVFPPMAAVVFPKLIGRNRTFEWLMSGDIYSAAETEKIGLVNHVFPNEDYDRSVEEYLTKFTSLSAAVISLTKIAIDKTMDKPAREGMTFVDMIYLRQLMKTSDANEGLQAFLDKRDPVWKHR